MTFLFPFIHLYLHSIARIEVKGREVLIQKISTFWKVSTPIFEGQGEFPKEANECLYLLQQLLKHREGILEIDAVTGTIHWTDEIHPTNFGTQFPRFLKDAQKWAALLSKKLSRV